MKDNEYRNAGNELAHDKFLSFHVPAPQCHSGCGYNVVGSSRDVIYWRGAYWHMDCAFQTAIAELEELKERVHGQ